MVREVFISDVWGQQIIQGARVEARKPVEAAGSDLDGCFLLIYWVGCSESPFSYFVF